MMRIRTLTLVLSLLALSSLFVSSKRLGQGDSSSLQELEKRLKERLNQRKLQGNGQGNGRKKENKPPDFESGEFGSLDLDNNGFGPDDDKIRKSAEKILKKVFKERFGGNGKEEVIIEKVGLDKQGGYHIRFRQVIHGMVVEGAMLYCHAKSDGTVNLVNGEFVNPEDVPTEPILNAEDAFVNAFPEVLEDIETDQFELSSEPTLTVVRDPEGIGHLAHKITIDYELKDFEGFPQPQRDEIFADSQSGEYTNRFPQYTYARRLETRDCGETTTNCPIRSTSSNKISTNDEALNAAHNFAIDTYNYFKDKHGRDSIDDRGMTLVSRVHYDKNYNNAFWDGSQMTYGDGDGTTFIPLSMSADIVAHELTHGVTSRESELIYRDESGALNEAMSDIFGALVEEYIGGKPLREIFLLGEDAFTPNTPGDGLRDMSDPGSKAGNAGQDYYPTRYTGTADNGGVHWNSGIANLAFYLLVVGGTHPRGKTAVSVTGIGFDKAGDIFYQANTNCLTRSSNFDAARSCTISAATTQNDKTQVRAAWAAVGVGPAPPTPPPSPTPPPPTAPPSPSPSSSPSSPPPPLPALLPNCIYLENFESENTAWTADPSSTCNTGDFEVGKPNEVINGGVKTQVDGDHTYSEFSDFSGSAFYTAPNRSDGDEDVDGGECIGTSPVYPVTQESTLSVWYFFGQRDADDDENGDYFFLEIQRNEGSWETLINVGDVESNAVWTEATTSVSPGSIKIRVRVSDGSSTGDLIEAGVDDLILCSTGSQVPSFVPSTPFPTFTPSVSPTIVASANPSLAPTIVASANPTGVPSVSPSALPTVSPTDVPSTRPSDLPSGNPTATASEEPTESPSDSPSLAPTSCANDGDCDDGVLCNGIERCSGGECLPALSPYTCPTAGDLCDATIDSCVHCTVVDFEDGAAGWTADSSSTCTTGTFVVGTPDGVINGGVTTQVSGDHTSGTGNAFYTAPNADGAGLNDVDGGECVAKSPEYPVLQESTLSMWYYHGQRDTGDDASGDFFFLEMSRNGGIWETLASNGDVLSNAAWTKVTVDVSPGTVELRVRVSDGSGPGDLVEAGVDDLTICSKEASVGLVSPAPSLAPFTPLPSSSPSVSPTNAPSVKPTNSPSEGPTLAGSQVPTLTASSPPSEIASASPSFVPTPSPSVSPSEPPTDFPSTGPTKVPSTTPSVTATESMAPSESPTVSRSFPPSNSPSDLPSVSPSISPSESPTGVPSASPTNSPSIPPSDFPSVSPSASSSELPTGVPSASPTNSPSITPSDLPSVSPSISPSEVPTGVPTANPTGVPSVSPSALPTVSPTDVPSARPSDLPSGNPTATASEEPTETASFSPSKSPSLSPNAAPACFPNPNEQCPDEIICPEPEPCEVCTHVTFEDGASGWTFDPSSTCSTGAFEVGTPDLVINGGVTTQPCGDRTSGDGNAFYTAPNTAGPGLNDVDGGECIGTSPVYHVAQESTLSLWYFFGQRDAGDDENGDYFALEMSTNGGSTYVTLVAYRDETVNAVWTKVTASVPANSKVVIRVRVSDGTSAGDLIEAGVDELVICPIAQQSCSTDAECNDDNTLTVDSCDACSAGCVSRQCVWEDFETGAGGWTDDPSSTCSTGTFEVGTPDGVINGGVTTQVSGDHTSGAGNAFYTAPNTGGAGTNDVDGGECIGTSPVYHVAQESTLSLWYYHGQRDAGDDQNGDYFALEMSRNGGSWETLASSGDVVSNAVWTEVTADVSPGTVTLRVRVSDGTSAGDLIEAGVDDLAICPK